MPTYLRKNSVIDQTLAKAKIENEAKSFNTYDDFISDYIEGYIGNLFADGIVETLTKDQVAEWLANPEENWQEISNYMAYLYYADGSIFQLYTIFRTLPDLNYSIEVIDSSSSSNEKNITTIRQTLKKVKYKELTRDILTQLCATGTVICTWLGQKKNPYLHVFSKNQYVFPKYRRNGEWVAVIDMAWFEEMNDDEREIWLENLAGIVSESDYNSYKNNTSDPEYQYIELPVETTKVLRINTLFRDQRIGFPLGTQYLFDYVQKQSFKNLETGIVNKVLKNIAVLTIGNKEVPWNTINPKVRKKVANTVHNTLQKTVGDSGTPVVAIPEWAKIEWAKIDGLDGLDNDKYTTVNEDISKDVGIPSPMLTGTEGNTASMKYSYTFLYKRIGEMLEQVEDVFNKLFYVLLGKKSDNFWMQFDKRIPLDSEKVLSALQSLHAEGFAIKPIIDILPDIEFQNYVDQSIYEQETLNLYETIKPPATSYTQSGSGNIDDSQAGAPTKDDGDLTDEGAKTRDGGKNGE